jgi:hypothetical protein
MNNVYNKSNTLDDIHFDIPTRKIIGIDFPSGDFFSQILQLSNNIDYSSLLNINKESKFNDVTLLSEYLKAIYGQQPSLPLLSLSRFFIQFILELNRAERKKVFSINLNRLRKSHSNLDFQYIDIFLKIKEEIRTFFQIELTCNVSLIGGKVVDFISNVPYNESNGDYDIWFYGDTNLVFEKLHKFNEGTIFAQNNITNNNVSYKYCESGKHHLKEFIRTENGIESKIQFIQTSLASNDFDNYLSDEDILNKFDFLHCCVGIDEERFFWTKNALKAIRNKNIVFNNLGASKVFHERIMKYINRGYTINYINMIYGALGTLFSIMNSFPNEDLDFDRLTHLPYDQELWQNFRSLNLGYENLTGM